MADLTDKQRLRPPVPAGHVTADRGFRARTMKPAPATWNPPEVVRFASAGAHPTAGRRREPGEPYAILTVPLDDGRRLVLELTDDERRRLQMQPTGCTQLCCAAPDGPEAATETITD